MLEAFCALLLDIYFNGIMLQNMSWRAAVDSGKFKLTAQLSKFSHFCCYSSFCNLEKVRSVLSIVERSREDHTAMEQEAVGLD